MNEFRDAEFDLVVAVCDDAARNCPVWLGRGKKAHLGFPDPVAATGSEDERMEVFHQVRNGLHQKVFAHLERAEASESEQGPEKDLYLKV